MTHHCPLSLKKNLSIVIRTLSVRVLRNKRKRLAIFSQLKRDKCDIILIQEAHITNDDINEWINQWDGDIEVVSVGVFSKGLLICIKKGLIIRDMKHCILNGVNEKMQLLKFKLEEEYFSISNVYAPIDDKEKVKFFNTLSNVIMKNVDISKENVIECGDMNSVMDNNMDIISGEKHDGNVGKAMISMFHKCALIDT